MSESQRKRPSDEEIEDLVAYLDGELPDTEAEAIEARLNVDADARQETEQLQKAWDLLDHLPRAEPSPDFTNRTVEGVRVRETTARLQARRQFWQRWGPRILVPMTWAACLLIAFGIGYLGYLGYLILPHNAPSDYELARELRLIENKRLYELVEDVEFLKELDKPQLFGEEGGGP